MDLKLLNDQGQAATFSAPDTIFGRDFNEALIHQIVVAFQANARAGNRAQKDRSEVKHSTKKPWRQKGTGRARAGMTSSPLWRGGGRIFPNSPEENFSQKVNKKMYRAGIRSLLMADQLHAGTLRPDPQLIDGRRAEGIRRRQDHPLAGLF